MEDRSLEEIYEELDGIMNRMEEADLSLEDAFALYNKGMILLDSCRGKIDRIEKEMMVLDEDGGQHEL